MNRKCYRLVYNRVRQAVMAVAEHARSQQSGARMRRRKRPRPMPLPEMVLLAGLLVTVLPSARSQIVADRSAPATQQATVLKTPNGLPLVNIQAPSKAGVSRNAYSQFDVPERGAILNNSNRDVQTRQGGWVQANPWLAAGPARVILNEVNGTGPSQLNGALEVAGSSAQVVLANASGITCQGCGFINAAGITLTTGKPQINAQSGALEGYRVQQGRVVIDGTGLDSGNASFTDIIARAVQVNAGIWANRLQVAAGAQELRGTAGTDLQTAQRLPDSDLGPPVAIDVAQLGGMYAGAIRLLGTADGVGVRNAGQIYAGAGELALTTDGRLENVGSMRAAQAVTVQAQSLDNAGSIAAETGRGSLLALQVKDTVNNTGLMAGDDLRIDAAELRNHASGRIVGERISLRADSIQNLGNTNAAPAIAAHERLDIASRRLANSEGALLYSDGALVIGGELDAQRHASGSAEMVNNASASMEAGTDLEINARSIRNSNEHFSLTTVNLPAQQIFEYQGAGSPYRYVPGTPSVYVYNDESDILQTPQGYYESWSSYVYTRNVSETRVASSAPARLIAGRDMRLAADTLVNDNSQIVAGRNIDAGLGRLENVETAGQRVTSDRGVVNNYWRDHKKGRDSTGWNQVAYEPPDVIESMAISPLLFRQNAPPQSAPTERESIIETDANGGLVRSGGLDLRVPVSGLFRPLEQGRYLVETDPAFASYRNWLGSDYLLSGLSINPAGLQKRLGDGYYEQKLVREQVVQLTGRRFLDNYSSDEAQYQALMDNAATFAQAHGLIPGVALSAEQMAELTSDIVWLVEKEIRLADGRTTRALVPQVYVRVREGDLLAGGALLSADKLKLDLGTLENQGSIAGRKLLHVDAQDLRNLGGRMTGDTVLLDASGDIENRGGSIHAGGRLRMQAGGDIIAASTSRTQSNAQGSVTHIDRMATLYVSGGSGNLSMQAGRDIKLDAVALASEGDIALAAGRDIKLGTVQQGASHTIVWSADNRRSDASTSEAGTVILAKGPVAMQAGRDVEARAATVLSKDEAVTIKAGQDLRIVAGNDTLAVDELHVHTGTSGILSSTTYTQHDQLAQSSARGSTIAGRSVNLTAGREMRVLGSTLPATEDVEMRAGGDVAVDAGGQSRSESHLRKEETSGVFSSGGIGFSIGSQDQTLQRRSESTSAAASSIVSEWGDIGIHAGKAYRQRGSDVGAAQGSVTVDAQSVEVREARQARRDTVDRSFEQSGLTVAVTSPVITAIQTVDQMRVAAGNSSDSRVKALAVANAALAVKGGVDAVIAGQGSTVEGRPNQIPTGNKTQDGKPETRDATLAERAGGINLAISVGNSSSRSTATIDSDIGRASSVSAGQDVRIRATGAGTDSNLTVQGSRISAGSRVALEADSALNLQAGRDTVVQKSSNSESSASVGVSIGSDGLLATAALSKGRGKADGSDVVHNNARVEAGELVTLRSGNDTSLQGAVVEAPRVEAKVGGDLALQSLQDSSQYTSKQQSAGGSLAIGTGRVSGNLAVSRGNIDSQYASVAEQSGIKAGDGGFDVWVQGKAALDGSVISGTQVAVDAGRNRFDAGGGLELRDVANSARYDANSTSVNFGTSTDPSGKLARLGTGGGVGQDGDRISSITQAGISSIAGNRAVRTGDDQQPLKRIFDLDRVQREVNAQVQVTQTFSAEASKALADYVSAKRTEIRKRQRPNATEAEKLALNEELQDLRFQERALNIFIGVLTGQSGSAVTKEGLSVAATKMRELMMESSRGFVGVTDGKAELPLTNMSGKSAGLNGDEVKLGGSRVDLDILCGTRNQRCVVQTIADGEPVIDDQGNTVLALDEKGRVQFDIELAGMTLEQFLLSDEGKKMSGPTGGVQGAQGTIFNIPYQPGSWMDKLIEAFAGTHDMIGGSLTGLYDESGNIKRGMSASENIVKQAWSATALLPSTPFALSEFFPPQVWNALFILIMAAR